jgi:hypothetical protein
MAPIRDLSSTGGELDDDVISGFSLWSRAAITRFGRARLCCWANLPRWCSDSNIGPPVRRALFAMLDLALFAMSESNQRGLTNRISGDL